MNYAAFRRFRGVLRCRSERGLAARRRATRAGMRRPGPACRAKSAERGVPRIRIVPMAGNRAQKAAASRFRLIAAAAGQDWILMLPKPRRTARPSPCQVLASPWNPSDRQRWRRQSRRSSSLHRRRRLRARSSAGWSALTATVFRFRLQNALAEVDVCGSGRQAAELLGRRVFPILEMEHVQFRIEPVMGMGHSLQRIRQGEMVGVQNSAQVVAQAVLP